MAESEEVYEVEQILGRRKSRRGQIEYLIRWHGYDSDWDSWEPLCNLGEALEIVEEFNERLILGQVANDNGMRGKRKQSQNGLEMPAEGKDGPVVMNGLPDVDKDGGVKKAGEKPNSRPGSKKSSPAKGKVVESNGAGLSDSVLRKLLTTQPKNAAKVVKTKEVGKVIPMRNTVSVKPSPVRRSPSRSPAHHMADPTGKKTALKVMPKTGAIAELTSPSPRKVGRPPKQKLEATPDSTPDGTDKKAKVDTMATNKKDSEENEVVAPKVDHESNDSNENIKVAGTKPGPKPKSILKDPDSPKQKGKTDSNGTKSPNKTTESKLSGKVKATPKKGIPKVVLAKKGIIPLKIAGKKSQADTKKKKKAGATPLQSAVKRKRNQRITRSKLKEIRQKRLGNKAKKDLKTKTESDSTTIKTEDLKPETVPADNNNTDNSSISGKPAKKLKIKDEKSKVCKDTSVKCESADVDVSKQMVKVTPTCDSDLIQGNTEILFSEASQKIIRTMSSDSPKRSLKDVLKHPPLVNSSSPKPTYKAVRKTVKRQVSESSTDSETLYSLTEMNGALLPKRLKCDTKESTPDLEVSFKGSQSPSPSKKLLLKNSMKPKTTIVRPVPRSPVLGTPISGTPPRPGSPVYYGEATSVYKTPPSSPSSIIAPTQGEPSCGKADHFMSDLPAIPVIPILPNSPSAASYKKLINDVAANKMAARGKRKNVEDDDSSVERRSSVRQSESAFRYKEIVVKKCVGYTQIWLFTQTKTKNALNPKVLQELGQALHNAKFDDSRLVMLSGSGSVFCSGVDLHYLLCEDRRQAATKMADAVREFISVLISFPKPLVAAVNGPAIGLGVAILPLCDVIYASDKASFYCPYARLSQTPEGCASYTFPNVMGLAMANELLLAGRKITAIEAYQIGLVSQVFWPTSMMQEVIPRLQNMSSYSAKAMEASKLLIRSPQRTKLEFTAESECSMLQERWSTAECHRMIRLYLDDEQDILV